MCLSNYLTIGKASKLLKVNPRTLRFYEQIGLVRPSSRSENGYRLYSPHDVEKIMFVRRAKKFGLTLDEIGSVLSLTEEGLCYSVKNQVSELLSSKISEIDNNIREMEQLRIEFTEFRIYLQEKETPLTITTKCSCLE
jgi:MerR family transcriptional regulator, Zn(II)-responsive regulator of zntA